MIGTVRGTVPLLKLIITRFMSFDKWFITKNYEAISSITNFERTLALRASAGKTLSRIDVNKDNRHLEIEKSAVIIRRIF